MGTGEFPKGPARWPDVARTVDFQEKLEIWINGCHLVAGIDWGHPIFHLIVKFHTCFTSRAHCLAAIMTNHLTTKDLALMRWKSQC